jgi:ubiquinone/menaquinone biosynthesis C-methylase UbiE
MNWHKYYAKPEGALGWLAGQIMARRNKERSEFVLALLDFQPQDQVLEIGFGPGADVRRASDMAGFVAGVDHSSLMVKQASQRNAAAIRAGKVKLELAPANQLPFGDAQFDKIFAINSAQFWKDSVGTIKEVGRVLKPGGVLALAIQPRNKGATDDHAYQAGRGLADAMKKAGFSEVRCESRQMAPVSTVCALGTKASANTD